MELICVNKKVVTGRYLWPMAQSRPSSEPIIQRGVTKSPQARKKRNSENISEL